MNAEEIKLDLIKRIDNLSDKELEKAYQDILAFLKSEDKSINEEDITIELKDALEKGIQSLDAGRSAAHEDVMKRMKKKYPNLIK